MEEKKVSIIVPVYNAAQYLERCVQKCLLRQSYGNVEIVLVDDGSTDESGRICDTFAEKYDNVKVLHKKNAGVSAARNDGLEICTGAYVTFVDADDYPKADMIEYLVGILEESTADVSGCDYFEFYSNAQLSVNAEVSAHAKKQSEPHYGKTEVLTGAEFIEKGILGSDTRCWSKLYRRESIGELRFDTKLTIGEDMLFLLELARNGKSFCRGNYKAYGYYMNESGAMMRSFKDSYMDQITCWQRAGAVISKHQPELTDRAETILLVSTMLVVGKLAMLSAKERREKGEWIGKCSELVKKYSAKKAVFERLDRGYKIKVRMYRYAPWLYMGLYHFRSYKKRKETDYG